MVAFNSSLCLRRIGFNNRYPKRLASLRKVGEPLRVLISLLCLKKLRRNIQALQININLTRDAMALDPVIKDLENSSRGLSRTHNRHCFTCCVVNHIDETLMPFLLKEPTMNRTVKLNKITKERFTFALFSVFFSNAPMNPYAFRFKP